MTNELRNYELILEALSNPPPTETSSGFSATGGTVTTVGNLIVHTFTTSGTFQVTAGNAAISYLVVAGGGGGGSAFGGGGGAGGLLTGTEFISVGSYTVTVGAGGA